MRQSQQARAQSSLFLSLLITLFALSRYALAQQVQTFYSHDIAHVCGPRQSMTSAGTSYVGELPSNCFPNSTEARSFIPVYINAGCAINATGHALCTTDNYTAVFPTPVIDAMSFSRRSCFLFKNGTVGCCDHAPPCVANLDMVEPDGNVPPKGFIPTPLQLVDMNVSIQMVVAGDYFACYLLSNRTVACAATRSPQIVRDAPPPDFRRSVLMMAGGISHVCILYDDYTPYCWGDCDNFVCGPLDNLLFSYISCGPTATCGVQMDGTIACVGNRLTSAVLNAPHGVYSQIQVNIESAIALSASDASVSIWSSSKTVSATTKAIPTVATNYLTVPCVPQMHFNPSLSPSLACWGDQGQAAGATGLDFEYLKIPLKSVAVGPQVACIHSSADGYIVCVDQTYNNVPPELQANTTQIGVVPGPSNAQPYAWKKDGVLRTWGKHPIFMPLTVDNNNAFRWSSFSFAMYGCAVCGILDSGKSTCVVGSNTTAEPDPCPSYASPSQILATYADLSHQPLDTFVNLAVYAVKAVDNDNCQNVDVCGVLQAEGSTIICAGQWFSEAARLLQQNSSILVLSFPTLLGSSTFVKNVTIQKQSSDVPFCICALANTGQVACWLLSSPSPLNWQLTPGYVPASARLSTLFADESLMYALNADDSTVFAWNPLDFNTAGTANTDVLPSMIMEVAPQFHYRSKAGPILPCLPGTYSLGVGNTSPACSGKCNPGYYGNTSISVDAYCSQPCPAGSYCPPGSVVPIPCPAGTYGADQHLMYPSCTGPCLAGYYCPAGSTTAWNIPCMPGTYTLDPSVPCLECDVNTYSSVAAPICASCPSGSFAPQTGSVSCITCAVTGLDCSRGQVRIEKGYWVDMSSLTNNFTDPSFTPYLCPPNYCDLPGGAVQNVSAAAANGNVFTNPCSAHRSLAVDNVLCGQCDVGYYEWNSVCTDCPTLNVPLLILLIFVSIVFVAILHRMSQSSSSSARVSILVYFVQSCLILLRAKSNTELAKVFAFLHVFNLSTLQPTGTNCLAQLSAQQSMLLHGLVPLFTLVLLYAFAFLQWLIYQFRARRRNNVKPVLWFQYIRTTISIALFAFQQMCFTLLEYLQCVDVGEYKVVFNTPSISCRSDDYLSLRPLVIVLFLFLTTVIPVALAWFLYRNRKLIMQDEVQASADESVELSFTSASIQPQSAFARRFDGLYIMFRPECYYWSVVIILRRVLLITIAVIMLSQPIYQFLLFNCSCLFILLLQIWIQPFRLTLDNQLEAFALLAVQFLSLLLSSQTSPESNLPLSIQLLAGALLSLPLVALLAFCAHHFLHQSAIGRKLYQRCIGICGKNDHGEENDSIGPEAANLEAANSPPSHASSIKIHKATTSLEELVAMDSATIGSPLATSGRSATSSLRARLLDAENQSNL